jgi:hypothetical protein
VTCDLQCDRNDPSVLPRHPIGVSVRAVQPWPARRTVRAPAPAGRGDHGTGPGGAGRTFLARTQPRRRLRAG